jgi:hypothetical protein
MRRTALAGWVLLATVPWVLTACAGGEGGADGGESADGGAAPHTEPGVDEDEDAEEETQGSRCNGTLGRRRVDGGLLVGAGETCRLVGTRVAGDVDVSRGGVLVARRVHVAGAVRGEGHRRVVVVRGSSVDGDVRLLGGRAALVIDAHVQGDLRSEDNIGRQVFRRNVVRGDLECEGNRRPPKGGANRVVGDKEGQCTRI